MTDSFTFYPQLLPKLGLNATVLLSFLMNVPKEEWISPTSAEIAAATGLSYKQQRAARTTLRDNGFIQERRRGIPARLYYFVCWNAVSAILEPKTTQEEPEIEKQEEGKGKVLFFPLGKSNNNCIIDTKNREVPSNVSLKLPTSVKLQIGDVKQKDVLHRHACTKRTHGDGATQDIKTSNGGRTTMKKDQQPTFSEREFACAKVCKLDLRTIPERVRFQLRACANALARADATPDIIAGFATFWEDYTCRWTIRRPPRLDELRTLWGLYTEWRGDDITEEDLAELRRAMERCNAG